MVTQTINFTTSSSNADLMANSSVKNAIKGALGLNDTAFAARLAANSVSGEKMGFTMTFDLVFEANNTVKINKGNVQNLVSQSAYSNSFKENIWSIIVGSAGNGTIVMNITR